MTLRSVAAALLASSCIAAPLSAKDPPARVDPCLVGVWEVTGWSDFESDSESARADRAGARGRFMYTPEGRMSVQVMLFPNAERIRGPQDIDGLAQAALDSIDYYGSYTADSESGTLIHHIEGSVIPN